MAQFMQLNLIEMIGDLASQEPLPTMQVIEQGHYCSDYVGPNPNTGEGFVLAVRNMLKSSDLVSGAWSHSRDEQIVSYTFEQRVRLAFHTEELIGAEGVSMKVQARKYTRGMGDDEGWLDVTNAPGPWHALVRAKLASLAPAGDYESDEAKIARLRGSW